MTESDHEIRDLYSAIGYVVIKWAFIEAALDFSVSTIYTDGGGNTLCKQMPKFLRDKNKFIVEAVNKLPKLQSFKKKAENITGRIMNIKDLREDFAHSVLTKTPHVNGVYSFARLDAKEHNHELKIWQFDVRDFPKMSDMLEALVRDTQEFAKSLELAFHKENMAPVE